MSQCFVSPQIVVWHMAEMQLKSVDWLVLLSKGEDTCTTHCKMGTLLQLSGSSTKIAL